MTDDEFLAAFEDTSLPRAEWTHEAHLRMAFLYLTRNGGAEAVLPIVRQRIRAYNAAQGNPTGYHETITVAFVRLVVDGLSAAPGGIDFAEFRQANPALFQSGALARYYSRERLHSAEARAAFVEPDLSPLP